MSKVFADRVEEVLGLLHGMAWPILEESDKQKIVAKIVRNIERHGDSQADWARALGVPSRTLGHRIERFRRSEPVDTRRVAQENARRRVNHAKAVLRDPDLTAELMEDPTARRNIAKAAVEHQAHVEVAEGRSQTVRDSGLRHRAGFNEVAGDLLRTKRLLGRALDQARGLHLDKDESDELRDDVAQVAAIVDWFLSFLDSGASDFDTELQRILEG